MHTDLLFDAALVLGLGMLAQWVAWRLRQPSITFLLLFGLLVGPISALVMGEPILDVEHLLGDLLFPFVSGAVAIILFEGGLSLRFRDLQGAGWVVGRLVSVGVLGTWLISGVAGHYLFGLTWEVALLLGATLVVTGPTVIIPLLKQIRPQGRVGSILRWEGIVIDPIGAILAVLVFDEILAGPDIILLSGVIVVTLAVGLGIGWAVAQVMVEIYRRYWVPDSLQIPMTIGFVLAAFAISNGIQPESGLLTVTVMGIAMANQRRFDIHHIVEFKETLQVLLLSVLFILLSARMQPSDLQQIGLPTLAYVLIIILVERPLAAFISTWGSSLTWQERIFIGWMAPRGIVAASVASIFAIELAERNVEGASVLLPITFAVIIATVLTYSLSSGLLARYLGLAEKNPQGMIIVGGSPWVRDLAKQVKDLGFRVVLSDTNYTHIAQATKLGIETYRGSILSELAQDEINFGGIGRLLALTNNPEVNALAGEHYENTFGAANVYELQRETGEQREGISTRLGGRELLPPSLTFRQMRERYEQGAKVVTVVVDNVPELTKHIPSDVVPLCLLPSEDRLLIWTQEDQPQIRRGNCLIALIDNTVYDSLATSGAIQKGKKPRKATGELTLKPETALGK